MPLTGHLWVDELFWSIMSTEFLIGGIVAVILDNLADGKLVNSSKPKIFSFYYLKLNEKLKQLYLNSTQEIILEGP